MDNFLDQQLPLPDGLPVITWQYVAGFFDGEGCVQRRLNIDTGRIYSGLSMHQGIDQGIVIYAISQFLKEQGIRHNVYVNNRRGKSFSKKDLLCLMVFSYQECFKFLTCIIPFVIVKRKACNDALLWYAPRAHKLDDMNRRMALALEARKLGSTWYEIAKLYKVQASSVRRRLEAV